MPFHEPHKGVDRSDPRASALFQLERNTRRGAVYPIRSTIPPETLTPITRETTLVRFARLATVQHARITPILTDTHAYACIQKNRNSLKRKREIFYRKRKSYNNLSRITAFFLNFPAMHEIILDTSVMCPFVYYNNYKLNANIIPNHYTSYLIIEIKNDVFLSANFSPSGLDIY